MGAGALKKIQTEEVADGFSTSTMLLAILKSNHPRPMTTYQMGLWVSDTQSPPRPLSVIVKTLAQDGLVTRLADAGKRAAQWGLTDRGVLCTSRRAGEIKLATIWISKNPNLNHLEAFILRKLLQTPTLSPQMISTEHGSHPSPVRTALKRLSLREFVARSPIAHGRYGLTRQGRSVANSSLPTDEPSEKHSR